MICQFAGLGQARYERPQMRLPGSGGIPNVTGYNDKSCLYVPRHSRAVLVEPIDFVSGLRLLVLIGRRIR